MDPDRFDKLIRGKSINFLIGSGASAGIYPTLSLGEDCPSFEEVVSSPTLSTEGKSLMYIFYFVNWLKPMALNGEGHSYKYKNTPNYCHYCEFIEALYSFLQNESNELPKRINIFTTNYDLLFERAIDDFLPNNPLIYFNDGSRGVFRKIVNNANFYLNVSHSGYNDNYRREVPTINLFKMHGSLSWMVEDGVILVNEINPIIKSLLALVNQIFPDELKFINSIKQIQSKAASEFAQALNDSVEALGVNEELLSQFMKLYADLPIINPDKYKFNKTVSEQSYYQMIRSFSYELEKKQAVLIVFGFSFADEHIKDIFERSLLNPELHVFILCYSQKEKMRIQNLFLGYRNITFLPSSYQNENNKVVKGDFSYLLSLFGKSKEV